MPVPVRDCPCHSKLRYRACCGPLHEGAIVAENATALMRSRYAAFALGRGEYLLQTLASTHPDRSLSAQEMSSSRGAQRFLDLCILHEAHGEVTSEVLFYARLFERGVDQSFVELSRFVREDGQWRYERGELLPASELEGDPRRLTLAQFQAQVAAD